MSPRIFQCYCASLLVSLLAGCAGHKRPPKTADEEVMAPAPAKPSFDAQAALAREIDPLPPHDIASPDGALKARVESSGEPQVTNEEGFIQIAAPMGDNPFVCFVYPEAKDGGELIRVMVDNTLAKAAPQHQWVDVHGDQSEGWGYLVARANYLVEGPKGKLLGDFKIAVSVRDDTSLVCLLDSVGLYGAFERNLRGLLASLDLASRKKLAKPLEASITRSQLPGKVVSLSRSTRKKQGRTLTVSSFETRLALGAEGTLKTTDDASNQTFKNGVLDAGVYASFSSGHMEYNLQLSREKKVYKVTGTVQDKPVTGEFTVEGPGIPDADKSNAEVCKVRDGKVPSVSLVDYTPDVDPLHPTTTTVAKATEGGDVVAKLAGTEGAEMVVTLDEVCDMKSGTLKIGAATVQMERLWHEKSGKP